MFTKEDKSVSRPPLLKGTNYAYWKAKTKIFIPSIDESTWDVIENEWTPPTRKVDDAMTKITEEVVKARSEWDDVERKSGEANVKALNTIFVGVEEQLKLISICTSAKKAWDIMEIV